MLMPVRSEDFLVHELTFWVSRDQEVQRSSDCGGLVDAQELNLNHF
jgi:hypothetical protein